MKVTVCFGDLKVVVPCGDGDFLVSELVEKAVTRYKKASAKPGDFWVKVHALKNQRDGGILDLDDVLNDVVDDKDLILAEYDEQRTASSPDQGEGDGTSSSSVGSMSPDLSRQQQRSQARVGASASTAAAGSLVPPVTIAATAGMAMVGSGGGGNSGGGGVLQHVARFNGHLAGSVAGASGVITSSAGKSSPASERRAKAPAPAPPPKPSVSHFSAGMTTSVQQQQLWRPTQPQQQQQISQQPAGDLFGQQQQHSSRSSVVVTETDLNKATGLQVLRVRRGSESNLVTMPAGDAAKTDTEVGEAGTLLKSEAKHWLPRTIDQRPPMNEMRSRHEPLGQSSSPNVGDRREMAPPSALRLQQLANGAQDESVVVALDSSIGGPLGIHVVPNVIDGRDTGLVIQDIEPGGRIDQDGRLSLYDLIEEINGCNILPLSFEEAQNIFRQALTTNQVVLRVRKNGGAAMAAECDPSFEAQEASGAAIPASAMPPGSEAIHDYSYHEKDGSWPQRYEPVGQIPPTPAQRSAPLIDVRETSASASSSLPISPPLAHQPASRSPSAQLTSPSNTLMKANTRKIGKRLTIELLKGPEGLGFSITTRDNPAGGVAPIYVKNILPKGAAIADGRLKSGDRILEINGIDTTGKSQDEAVAMLRNTKRGSVVTFVVSRQELTEQPSTTLPRQLHMPLTTPFAERFFAKRVQSCPVDSRGAADINDADSGSAAAAGARQGEPLLPIASRAIARAAAMMNAASPPAVAEAFTAKTEPSLPTNPSAQEHAEDALTAAGVGVASALAGKQLLSFDIPLNESGSAGLGVSVKGKTSSASENGAVRDLGIFVKAVITGGAASKDGRVLVNDQLIEVNGDSLLDKSNAEAMDALRRAMRAGGPAQGHIRLTVARAAAGSPAVAPSLPSTPEPLDREDDEIGIESAYPVTGSRAADARRPSDGGVIDSRVGTASVPATIQQSLQQQQQRQQLPATQPKSEKAGVGLVRGTLATVAGLRNPVLDRLTGSGGGGRMDGTGRGDDEENSGGSSSSSSSSDDPLAQYGANATTLPTPQAPRDTVIIEDDSQPVVQRREKVLYPRRVSRSSGSDLTKARPYSAIGGVGLLAGVDGQILGNVLDTSTSGQLSADPSRSSSSNGGGRAGAEKLHRESTMSPTTGTFEREGFGRRSFSEKRKVEKNKELVEKAKALRDDAKEKDDGRPMQSMPSSQHPAERKHLTFTTGGTAAAPRTRLESNEMPKAKLSSSTENLGGGSLEEAPRGNGHAVGVTSTTGGTGASVLWRPLAQGPRGRACNESFRAAVDRSYDGPPASGRAAHVMSIGNVLTSSSARQVQEEGSDFGPGAIHSSSARSSFSDRAGSAAGSGAASLSSDQAFEGSKSQKKEKKASKVSSGGFLGNLLRFTKARKSMEDRMPSRTPSSASSVEPPHIQLDTGSRPGSSQGAPQPGITAGDKSRIDERYRRLQDTQRSQLVAAASTASSSSSASGSSTAGSASGPSRQQLLLLRNESGDYAEIPARDYGRTSSPALREPLPSGHHQLLVGDKASRSRQEHRDRQGERKDRYQQERDDFYEQKIRELEAREWEANNRANANVANGHNPNWKVPMMVERGGSDVPLVRQQQPDVVSSSIGSSGDSQSGGTSVSRDAAGSTRPYLYESNRATASTRPAAAAAGPATALAEASSGSRERPLQQPQPRTTADAQCSSLSRHPRARTPEPQTWKRHQLPQQNFELQQQNFQLQQQTSGLTYQTQGPIAVSPSVLSRGHHRYASYDSTSAGNVSWSGPTGAYPHDYDDPRRAYAEHVTTMTARAQQLQRQQPAVNVDLRRNLATGPAQV